MQSATTADLIFDVATLVALISEAMTLEPGDLIITGTPAGVGAARKPPGFMKAGDVCQVEIEGIGICAIRLPTKRRQPPTRLEQTKSLRCAHDADQTFDGWHAAAGRTRLHSLDHFSMTVPSLEQARHFYQSFGLDVREEGRGLALYAPGLEHRWGILNEDKSKKLHYLSFGAFEDDLPRFRDRLSVLHVERLAPPPGFESNGLWFRDHNGVLVEIGSRKNLRPTRSLSFTAYSAPAGVHRARAIGARRRRRAGAACASCALHPPTSAARSVFTAMCWACASPTRRKAMSPSCMARTAATITWSRSHARAAPACIVAAGMSAPCRRSVSAPCRWPAKATPPAGDSAVMCWARTTSTMCASPWGSYSEYSADMDYIPAGHDWRSGDHPGEDSFFLWGPNPPEDFVRNYEIET